MDTTVYETLRPKMQTGDAIVFAGTNLISKAIQWFTKSPYSHVAMVARLKLYQVERVFLFQATARYGVAPVPVSRYLSAHNGVAWWVPLHHDVVMAEIPDYQLKLLDVASVDFGRGYDYTGIGQFLIPKWFQQNQANKFCSEAYASWLNSIGLRQETFVSPAQFTRQPIFQVPVSLA